MDEEQDVKVLIEEMAAEKVDEEITHHPELEPQRETLLKNKVFQVQKLIEEAGETTVSDLDEGLKVVDFWIESLPPQERERVQKEFKMQGEELEPEAVPKLSEATLQALFSLGYQLQMDGDFASAKGLFTILCFLYPGVGEYWVHLGYACLSLTQLEKAKEAFHTALEIDPDNISVYYYLALCAAQETNKNEALHYIEHGLSLTQEENPDWPTLFKELKQQI